MSAFSRTPEINLLDSPLLTDVLQGPLSEAEIWDMLGTIQELPTDFRGRTAMLLSGSRGERLALCRAHWQWFTDGVHKWCRPSNPCELIIACPACAEEQAMAQRKQYDGLFEYVPELGFTRMTFRPDFSNIKESFDLLTKALRKHLPKAPTVSKIKPATRRIEVLYCGPLPLAGLAALLRLYPTMQQTLEPRLHFREELGVVLAPDLPSIPAEVAELDSKYRKTRLLRVQGLTQEQRRKLSVIEESPITDNFSSDGTGEGDPSQYLDNGIAKPVPRCPHCGRSATKFTPWVVDGANPPTEHCWQDVILYTPPVHIE